MSRGTVIITILSVVAATGYNLKQMEHGVSSTKQQGKPPVVESAPSVRLARPGSSSIANPDLWNVKPDAKLPNLKEMFKPFYSVSKTGRFEALQRSDRPAERWEFQGVVIRGVTPRALFYNTGLKRIKNVGRGEMVDEQLKVRTVTTGGVSLEVMGEKKPLIFELRIFNANKESYATKRKTP